jgi:hypothetical protein
LLGDVASQKQTGALQRQTSERVPYDYWALRSGRNPGNCHKQQPREYYGAPFHFLSFFLPKSVLVFEK